MATRSIADRRLRQAPVSDRSFAAFLSYSHGQDRELARVLQTGIEQFGRPWYRPRVRRVFRDDTNLAAAPYLWGSIENALTHSQTFLLLASRQAAASSWVDKEVEWWQSNRSLENLLIVLTDGDFVVDSASDKASSTALPPTLRASLQVEPHWIDVRELRNSQLDLKNPEWQNCLADIVAALDQRPKDALIGEHIRQGRRTRRLVVSIVAVLTLLLIASVGGGLLAVNQRNRAQQQTLVATSRQLAAESTAIRDAQPGVARQLLAQAYRLAPTDQVLGGLIESASMPRVIAAPGSRAVEFSKKRGLIAIISDAGVTLHDPVAAKPIVTFGDSASSMSLAFSHDDRLLAVGDERKAVRIFDVEIPDKPALRTTIPLSDAGMVVAFVGDSSTLLAVGVGHAGLELWDIANSAAPRRLGAVATDAQDLGVSPDGKTLATATDAITLWDIEDPRAPAELATLKGHEAPVTSLDFDPRGRWLASGAEDDTARLWNVTDPSKPTAGEVFSGQSLQVKAVEFSPNGETLAVGAGDTTIHLWDLADPLRPRQGAVLTGHTGEVEDLSFDPYGHTLASVGTDGPAVSYGSNGSVRLWTVVGASRSEALTGLPARSPTAPSFSSDGQLLATGLPTTLWSLANPANPQQLSHVTTYNAGGQATALSPNGHLLASGDPLVLWDVTDPRKPQSLTPDVVQDEGAMLVAFSPNSSVVLTADGDFRLWDVVGKHPSLAATLPGSARQQGAAFAPNSKMLATRTADGRTQLWDVSKPSQPKALSVLPAEAGTVESVVFASDTLIITGNTTGLVSLWDVHNPAKPSALSTLARHSGTVSGLAVQGNGALLASAADDGTIRLTTIRDPAQPVEITALHSGGLYDPAALAFSPDGGTLAAASVRTFVLWSVDVSAILRRLCADSETITRADWDRYLPGFPYDPPCA